MLQLRRRLFSPAKIIYMAILFYMIYHLLFSNKGLMTLFEYKEKYKNKLYELQILQSTVHALEQDIYLLHPDTLSHDVLEEQARLKFNLLHKNEQLILLNNSK